VTLPAAIRREVERATGTAVVAARPVAGGDVAVAHAVELGDGRRAFLKSSPRAPAGSFTAEARGLRWLAEPAALRVPEVLAVGDGAGDEGFLLLPWIESAAPARDHDERLGRGLAALHRAGWREHGGPCDGGFLAGIPTDDRACPDAGAFWVERRLLPLLRRVERAGRATRAMRDGIERVASRIAALAGPPEPPARLHGDLWGGNAITDEHGAPCLVDPAAYASHREIDLAMMRLFGGFSPRVFAAYDEAWPLAPGHEQRVPLWQLTPLLVHVLLFGGGYVGQVESTLARLV
jgi:fructosamine-3-kinase